MGYYSRGVMNLKLHKQQIQDILDSYQWIIDESEVDPDLKDDPLYNIYYAILEQLNDPNPEEIRYVK